MATRIKNSLPSATDLARAAYAQASDAISAADIMYQQVINDPVLKREFLDVAFRTWCGVTVNSYLGAQKRQNVVPATIVPGSNPIRYIANRGVISNGSRMTRVSKCTMLDTPMFGGIRLGDMLRPDLLGGAAKYQQDIATMTRQISLANALASQLPDDITPVRGYFTEAQVEAIEKAIS